MSSLVSINVAKPTVITYQQRDIPTGIFKIPALTPIKTDHINLEGDGQADLINHGGADKAICVYPYEHYSFWEQTLQKKLEFGAFGENFTVLGMTEDQVCIGDIYQLDEVVVQVSQPRQPCFKLAAKYEYPEMPVIVQTKGYTGYYLRVLQAGTIHSIDSLQLLQRHKDQVRISEINTVLYHDKRNRNAIERILQVDAIAERLRHQLQKRLEQ